MKKLLLSIAFLLPTMGMMAQTQVKTAEGILEGKDLSGITVFKGVPFAAPPVGNLRWKAPQPAQKWQGVREAKEFVPSPSVGLPSAAAKRILYAFAKVSETVGYFSTTPRANFSSPYPIASLMLRPVNASASSITH